MVGYRSPRPPVLLCLSSGLFHILIWQETQQHPRAARSDRQRERAVLRQTAEAQLVMVTVMVAYCDLV